MVGARPAWMLFGHSGLLSSRSAVRVTNCFGGGDGGGEGMAWERDMEGTAGLIVVCLWWLEVGGGGVVGGGKIGLSSSFPRCGGGGTVEDSGQRGGWM